MPQGIQSTDERRWVVTWCAERSIIDDCHNLIVQTVRLAQSHGVEGRCRPSFMLLTKADSLFTKHSLSGGGANGEKLIFPAKTIARWSGRMQGPSSAPRPRLRRAQGSLESSCRGEYSALNMARPTQRARAFRTRPPSHKRAIGACKDKANLSRPPVGLSGPGHRKPLTTGQRPDIAATLMIRVPHSRRPASSRFHALFPAKHSPATDQGRKKTKK